MASRVFRVLEIEPLQQGESVIDMTPDNIAEIKATALQFLFTNDSSVASTVRKILYNKK